MNIAQVLLYPISVLYGIITFSRNFLYEKKILKSTKFSFPIINIGNISVGGTGKTPHTNYLINLLKQEYNIAVLSRGYNRKSHGYIELQTSSKAEQVGDEPLFYKWKHPDIKVAVCEDRVFGVSQMAINEDKELVYLLDDAFQHRAIKAGINIVLTDYNNLYYNDYLLPSGRLRESKKGINRADIIIVTKCPSPIKKDEIRKEIAIKEHQFLIFSSMQYLPLYSVFNITGRNLEEDTDVVLVSGIAKPKPLILELENRFNNVYTRNFGDHYNYKLEDIYSIIRTYKNLNSQNKIIVTTEKDATRLFAFRNEFLKENIDIFCIPIEVKFEKDEKLIFDKAIKHYLSITLPKVEEEYNENREEI